MEVPVWPHFLSPNEVSRWAATAAIVDYHTLEVGSLRAMFGGRLEDLSLVDGRFYSNKPPGMSLLGVVPYAMARAMVGPASPDTLRITLTAMRWLLSSLPLLLLAWMMMRAGAAAGMRGERIAQLVMLLLFATPLFAYGMLLFSHALAAFALFGAWVLLFSEALGRRPALAGALIGLAVLSDFAMALPAAVLIVCAAIASWRALLPIAGGGAPFAAVLLAYDKLAFGRFFALSYAFYEDPRYRALAHAGLFGIELPSPAIFRALLFDPSRGLLVLSPVLLCSVAGLAAARRLGRPAFWSLVLAPLTLLALYSGYPNWHGGWGLGARYVVPAVPFLVFLLGFVRSSFAENLLSGMSVAAIVLLALVFPFVPPGAFPLPWGSLALPILEDGLVAPNLLHFVGRAPAVVVPFLVAVAAVAIGTPRRWWVAVALGAFAMVSAGALYAGYAPALRASRAYFEEVYFDQRGAIRAMIGAGPPLSPAQARRMRDELASPPPSWPF